MKQKVKLLTITFLVAVIAEGLITLAVLLTIPPDPKNAFLLGYSKSRILLMGGSLILWLGFILALIITPIRNRLVDWFNSSRMSIRWAAFIGGISALLLWLSIWTPPSRLEEFGTSFTRLLPFLLWVEVIGVQFFLIMAAVKGKLRFSEIQSIFGRNKTVLPVFFGAVIIISAIFYALKFFGVDDVKGQLFFAPGAPLSSLQVFLGWVAFLVIFMIEQKNPARRRGRKVWTILLFVVIWASTFIAWNYVHFPCTDDRPGPFPPNNICYPDINDAVFSIGSHYITLGEGINHHWMTDKPLYMVFLAVSQWIAGPNIDRYLSVQVAVLALIPALLFLFGKKFGGNSTGLFLGFLSFIGGVYAILLYRQVGSVNVRYENSDIFISLLMVALVGALFKWIQKPADKKWGFVSGGLLGVSILVRFNPILIGPLVVICLLLVSRRAWKSAIPALLCFVLAVGIVVIPWFASASDVNGNNFYYVKIRDVLSGRFNPESVNSEAAFETASENTSQQGVIAPDKNPIDATGSGLAEGMGASSLTRITYHFLNNVYVSLAKLPTTLFFAPIEQQVKGPIWSDNQGLIWKGGLTIENQLALLINLTLVMLGVFAAWKKLGVAGFSGLIVQIGYFLGNTAAMTSGGRYVDSVSAITLIYYAFGIFSVTVALIRIFDGRVFEPAQPESELNEVSERAHATPKSKILKTVGLVLPFLLVGISLPILNHLPGQMAEESGKNVETQAYQLLSGRVSDDQWQKFLKDPQKLVVRGVAYHPAYFRSSSYYMGDPTFELMVLGKQHVIVSHILVEPDTTFRDGSEVILIGCQTGKDNRWSADRILMQSYVIFQLDNEKSSYFDPDFNWNCSKLNR